MKFINITRFSHVAHARSVDCTSSFGLSDRHPDVLETIGAIPHAYSWRPTSENDRDALVAWLQSLRFETDAQRRDRELAERAVKMTNEQE